MTETKYRGLGTKQGRFLILLQFNDANIGNAKIRVTSILRFRGKESESTEVNDLSHILQKTIKFFAKHENW